MPFPFNGGITGAAYSCFSACCSRANFTRPFPGSASSQRRHLPAGSVPVTLPVHSIWTLIIFWPTGSPAGTPS